MDFYALPAQAYPALLIIDADEERAQRMARLLTLANYRPYVAYTPVQAFDRFLSEQFVVQAVVLGLVDDQARRVLERLAQRMRQIYGARIPAIPMPQQLPDEALVLARDDMPYFHTHSHADMRLLEAIWAALPTTRPDLTMREQALVLTLLPAAGMQPHVTHQRRSRNSHLRQVLSAGQRLVGAEHWETLLRDVGLDRYSRPQTWPLDNDRCEIPAEYPALLNQAVAFSQPDTPAAQLRRWSEMGTNTSLTRRALSAVTRQALKLMPKDQVMSMTLNAFTKEMNEIRGETLHEWSQRPDGCYWLVHYSNLYAYGRAQRDEPQCHVWIASLEATLRLVGMEGAWEAVELECSCQTLTGHCLFVIRPRAQASEIPGRSAIITNR